MAITLEEKLTILSAAAKYDVSCASSGSTRKNVKGGLGNAQSCGICHTFTDDGRCVSLLKLLFTNRCIYDCAFCVSRRSNDVVRTSFTVDEVVDLTVNFYRRNYIEGLFLSSGITVSPDNTMEKLIRVVMKLRLEERFNGYIHLKAIPGASDELITLAGLYVDRMSVNMELPTESSLKLLAPDKTLEAVEHPLSLVNDSIVQYKNERRVIKSTPRFVPAGQSTQMVIGAGPENDMEIMYAADSFYRRFALKRVYYSGYIALNTDSRLPVPGSQTPLLRENRLYQTDWLLRFYQFDVRELLTPENPHLDTDIDPKLSWALRNLHFFPVDVNTADYALILRVPGIGRLSAQKIVQARRYGKLRSDHLKKLGVAYNRARYFIYCVDSERSLGFLPAGTIKQAIVSRSKSKYLKTAANQLALF